jgi:hypothetical protein
MTAATGLSTVDETDVSVWWRWWAIASFAHVVGAPTTDGDLGRGLANVVVGWVAIAVVARPGHRLLRTALAAAVVVSAVAEAPLIGNHWWLAAAVSVGALAARPWSAADDDFSARFGPTARLVLLTFYSFAAFAKLNAGFLDPVESCARFFANQTLSFYRLPEVGAASPIASFLAVVTVVIELAVPVLLLVRPTRRWGVWLAVVFHLLLTLDLRQHFYDFTLVLVPLFALFAPPSFLRVLDRSLPRSRAAGGVPWMVLAGLQVAAFHLPVGNTAKGLAIVAAWGTWVALLALIARGLVRVWREGADRVDGVAPSGPLTLRPAGLAAPILVALVVANGLAPYLEVKTATGFNMYANLVTADGESNHLVVGRTAGLRSAQAETVTIVDSDHEGLAEYVDSGFTLPVVNLADFLADHPDVSVTWRRADGTIESAPGPSSVEPRAMAWWEERFLLFRAVPVDDPPACQNAWLPAR